ncbi:MAG TPA: DUF2066 domain-containing protein [Stellaceae bacterium]|jgi:hypothetical protein|nr:DUF2066 domain-containing protein [Stellaceae bacterium]
MDNRRARCRRFLAKLLLVLSLATPSLALPAHPAGADATGDLYKTTVIVTGYDMRSRPSGFARALREVLVKLSGEPRLDLDPRVGELSIHADQLVTKFDYVDQMAGIKVHDDQGTYDRPYNLTVVFDPGKIDAALADLGEHSWLGERPVIVPVLAVERVTKSYLLSAENPTGADQAGSLATIAQDVAMTVRIPTEAELARWGVSMGGFPSPKVTSTPDQAVVAGTLEFREELPGWVGSWHLRWHGTDYAWSISGVNFDDAFRDLVRGVMRVASGHDGPT